MKQFDKRFTLIDPIEIEKIKAKVNDKGELIVDIPKVKQEVKKIQIE